MYRESSCWERRVVLHQHGVFHAQRLPGPHLFPGSADLSVLHKVHSLQPLLNLRRDRIDRVPRIWRDAINPVPTEECCYYQSSRSTKTWIVPPQARPICSTFSSSVMPNSSICGLPFSITSIAAWTTAGSTHPPLTEPANSPLSLTASLAPGRRGADPYMETTVATATRSPRVRPFSISGNTSRICFFLLSFCPSPGFDCLAPCCDTTFRPTIINRAQYISQMNQTIKIMGRQEIIDERQGCLHPDRQGAVIR